MSTARPRHILAKHPFFSCNSDLEPLFEVRPGVPLDDGLNIASTLLGAADSAAVLAAETGGEDAMWAAHYLIEMAHAILEAALHTLLQENRHV